jgi:hypothetical protein
LIEFTHFWPTSFERYSKATAGMKAFIERIRRDKGTTCYWPDGRILVVSDDRLEIEKKPVKLAD